MLDSLKRNRITEEAIEINWNNKNMVVETINIKDNIDENENETLNEKEI